jgi:hypothetical protein
VGVAGKKQKIKIKKGNKFYFRINKIRIIIRCREIRKLNYY